MQYGISILLSGISLGGQYALIAIGYTMVYGILRLINFAHGDVFMVAGLMMVYLSASLPLAAAIPLMIILTVLLGFIIERAAYKPLRTAPRMSVMISAIGVSYLLENTATYVTGGQPIMEELGVALSDVTLDMLGTAKSVKVTKDATTIVDGAGKKADIEERINTINAQIEETSSDFDREKLQERKAKLSGGVAVIKVGAATEAELKETKSRIDDALQATHAAVEEGIVAGGGAALIDAMTVLDDLKAEDVDEQVGINIVSKACEAPMRAIAENSGFEGSVVIDKIKRADTAAHKRFTDIAAHAADAEHGHMRTLQLFHGLRAEQKLRSRKLIEHKSLDYI